MHVHHGKYFHPVTSANQMPTDSKMKQKSTQHMWKPMCIGYRFTIFKSIDNISIYSLSNAKGRGMLMIWIYILWKAGILIYESMCVCLCLGAWVWVHENGGRKVFVHWKYDGDGKKWWIRFLSPTLNTSLYHSFGRANTLHSYCMHTAQAYAHGKVFFSRRDFQAI